MKNCQVDIVLVSGYKRHGKDSFANFLQSIHGFKRYAFADRVKELSAAMFGIPLAYFHDDNYKEQPLNKWPFMSPRQIMTKFASDCMAKHFDNDIWVRFLAKQIAENIIKTVQWNTTSPVRLKYVISDVRFKNEQQIVNFIIQELQAANVMRHIRINTIHCVVRRKHFSLFEKIKILLFDHVSERGQLFMKYDVEIQNNKSLAELETIARALYSYNNWHFAVDTYIK